MKEFIIFGIIIVITVVVFNKPSETELSREQRCIDEFLVAFPEYDNKLTYRLGEYNAPRIGVDCWVAVEEKVVTREQEIISNIEIPEKYRWVFVRGLKFNFNE